MSANDYGLMTTSPRGQLIVSSCSSAKFVWSCSQALELPPALFVLELLIDAEDVVSAFACALLIAECVLLTTECVLLTAKCVLTAECVLLTAECMLLTADCECAITAEYALLTASLRCVLRACPPPSVYCPVRVAHRRVRATHRRVGVRATHRRVWVHRRVCAAHCECALLRREVS